MTGLLNFERDQGSADRARQGPEREALVRMLHREVGERLQQAQAARAAAGEARLRDDSERVRVRGLINDVLRGYNEQRLVEGGELLSAEAEFEIADGIYARLYGAGRLQPLLNDPDVENVDINGPGEVWVTYADGRRVSGPAVAESDEELIELVQMLASYAGLSSRPFDSANPELDLRLPDDSRLSAVMGVAEHPAVSIRRHRFATVTLADLVGNQTLSVEAAEFLAAAVRARHNIMIAGATDAGKTTMLRALAAEIGEDERLITVERSLELGLRRDVARHPNVLELEERLPNSEGAGRVSMAQLVRRTLRQNPDRVIVGEVLGDEIVTMLNAMSQGNDGSLSTIHARSAREVFNRIATYAIQSAEQLPREATFSLVAGALDFVVFLGKERASHRRRLRSILEINGYDPQVGVSASEIFGFSARLSTNGDAGRTDAAVLRDEDLTAAGWGRDSFSGDSARSKENEGLKW